MNYRNLEIDGLRAISVISVLLYHVELYLNKTSFFSGGFIGVDIFFVISGYLISSIIINEFLKTKKFSFKKFYENRIRRILPVFFAVIIASSLIAFFYLLPNDLVKFAKSSLYSLGLSSNFYFHYSGQEYWAKSSLYKPLLHFWSLSIEKQFYILFPIFLLVILKFIRKYTLYILIFCISLSLLLAHWLSNVDSSLNFYILITRLWEFLSGSIIAYLKIFSLDKKKNNFLPLFGLFLIFFSIIIFGNDIKNPSLYTLFPIIGSCLILYFSNENELAYKILSFRPLVFIGLISYSLYMWHYPILAFSKISGFFDFSDTNKIKTISLIIILSILSYFLIEKPFLNKNRNFKFILLNIFFAFLIIITFSFYVVYKTGKIYPTNIVLEDIKEKTKFRDECKYSTDKVDFINEIFFKEEFVKCKKKLKNFVLIIGDSHSINIFNSFSKLTNKNTMIIGLNKDGCRPTKFLNNDCQFLKSLEFIENNKNNIKYIFFTMKGSYFLTNKGRKNQITDSRFRELPIDKNQIEYTFNFLKDVRKLYKNLIFLGPHLEPNINLTKNNITRLLKGQKFNDDTTNYDIDLVDKRLKKLSKFYNIQYVSKIDSINFDFKKDMVVDSKITFFDTDHWSSYGEIYFGKKLILNTDIKKILHKNLLH